MLVDCGVVELETGDEAVGIGEAVLDPSTRARIEAGPQGTTIVVMVGRAILEDNVIAAGQQITLGPAGRPVANVAAHDAGVRGPVGVAMPPAGQIAIAVRDKPARIKTAASDKELAVGEHLVEPN